MKKAATGEPPMVIVDEQRAIEVHLLSDLTSGSEVLKLSAEEEYSRKRNRES